MIIDILQYCFELALALSVFGCISVSWFPLLILGNFRFSLWCNMIYTIINNSERIDLNKKLNWDLILVQLYLDLSTALLVSLLLLGIFDIGDTLFDAIMCLKSSAYIGLKTIYDIHHAQGINTQILFQSLLFIL